jgi:hypothetical protein
MDDNHGLAPSSSTSASVFGAFLAATIVFALHAKGIDVPAGYEALLGGAMTAAAGYIPRSGRRPKS